MNLIKNIIKVSALLLIAINGTTQLNAMNQNKLYFTDITNNQIYEMPFSSINGMKFIENQIQKGKGFSEDDPIQLPVSFIDLLRLVMNRDTLFNEGYISQKNLYHLLKIAKKLQFTEMIKKLHAVLPPAPLRRQ
jgi:hypothetical protein